MLAFVIGSIGGVLVGFWFARQPRTAAVFDPYVKMANALPRVVLAPIFTLWLGLGIWSKVALGVTLVFFIVFFNVYQGVKEVSPTVLANARMLGMSERQLMRHVYWPSALSWMFSSLHTSVGFAVVGAVVGEYLGSAAGLGYLIQQAEGVFDVAGVFAGMFVLAAFVIVIDTLVTLVEKRLLVWRPLAADSAGPSQQPPRWPIVGAEMACSKAWRNREEVMSAIIRRIVIVLAALVLSSGLALAQSKSRSRSAALRACAICRPCSPRQLGEFKKAGVEVDVVQFKGGSESLKAVMGGSADVVSGYFDHCVNLAAKGQHLQSFVVYDRYPGLALVVSPKHAAEIKSVKDLANKKVGVSAPGSSTDFFLKYLLSKNGVDPNSVGVIGVGLGASAVAAMEQGEIDAAVMLDPAVTMLQRQIQGSQNPERHAHPEGHAGRVRRRISGRRALHQGRMDRGAREGSAGHDQRDRQHAEVDPLAYAPKKSRTRCRRICRQGQGALSSPRSRIRFRCIRKPAAWTRRAPQRCWRCSANLRPTWPRPISTCRRPTPTSMSTRRTRRWG